MKTVFLLRHGKSVRGPEYESDFVRPLAKRGTRDSRQIGEFMKHYGLIPDFIISSDATRAYKTAERAASFMKYDGEIQLKNDLYSVGSESYIESLKNLDSKLNSVMLVGHNPDLEEVVEYLSSNLVVVSTAALVRIDMDISSWKSLKEGEGNITLVIKPKGLIATADT